MKFTASLVFVLALGACQASPHADARAAAMRCMSQPVGFCAGQRPDVQAFAARSMREPLRAAPISSVTGVPWE